MRHQEKYSRKTRAAARRWEEDYSLTTIGAGSGKAAFISLSGLSGQRLLTESQAGALENGLEKPLLE